MYGPGLATRGGCTTKPTHARLPPFPAVTWATRNNPVAVATAVLTPPAIHKGIAKRRLQRLPAPSRIVTTPCCHKCTWYVIMPRAHCFSRTPIRRRSPRAACHVEAAWGTGRASPPNMAGNFVISVRLRAGACCSVLVVPVDGRAVAVLGMQAASFPNAPDTYGSEVAIFAAEIIAVARDAASRSSSSRESSSAPSRINAFDGPSATKTLRTLISPMYFFRWLTDVVAPAAAAASKAADSAAFSLRAAGSKLAKPLTSASRLVMLTRG